MLNDPQLSHSNQTILLVDDHPGVLYSTSKILASHQYKVTTAKSAAEAMSQVKNQAFDLVVCDINMPGRSGLEFLNDLKQYDPTIASVVLTANGTVGMAIQAMKSGALGFVTKPFNEAELLESIQAALEQADLVRNSLQLEFYSPMLESLCSALLRTMEADDFATEGGSHIVARYAQDIANELGLPGEQMYQIYLAGLFHDIGKIGISDKIVRKAGPLTPEEQQEMTLHPELGSRIIEQAPGMTEAARIIRHHHERFDGSGYPDGLAGEAIPLGSRIVSVADVFDEMISTRIYSIGKSKEAALEELKSYKGTQFDPQVVDVALRLFEKLD